MIQKVLFKVLMAPFALLYGLGVALRNWFYEVGILKSIDFNLPVISVGNMAVGGTGKTPHVEYLADWLRQYLEVAILSRGYKRKSKGFHVVRRNSTVDQVGDEPLQYKRKFDDVGVYVAESRVIGVPKIVSISPGIQTIILDDAFQHRSVKPGLNILLTNCGNLFTRDFLLPMGTLREWRSAYQRADVIIVSKCPDDFNNELKTQLINQIKPQKHQSIFFSRYRYHPVYHLLFPEYRIELQPNMNGLVISAIANTEYLFTYLEKKFNSIKVLEYEDHHDFTSYEIGQLKKQFDHIEAENKIIITTQKDAVRLEKHAEYIRKENLPVFVLPVSVQIIDDEENFRMLVRDYLMSFKS